MSNVMKITGGIFTLILLYLLLSNGAAFNATLKTATDAGIRGITVLQGRDGTKTPS